MSTNPPTLLANEVDNKNLCPNSDGSGCVGCQTSEKKAYGCSKINVPCTNIRFTTTGRTAYYDDNWKAFALSGIELFGKLIKGEEHTFTHNNTLRTKLVLIFCFIYS